MATRAARGAVGSGQGEIRLVMCKGQRLPHLGPRVGRMALLAIPLDLAMRVLRPRSAHCRQPRQKQDSPKCDEWSPHPLFKPSFITALE